MRHALLALMLCGCAARPINPGAHCEIFSCVSGDQLTDMAPPTRGRVNGLYYGDSTVSRIYVRGPVDNTAMWLVHEYTHYLIHEIPEKRAEITAAFRGLMTPDFEYGHNDLMVVP